MRATILSVSPQLSNSAAIAVLETSYGVITGKWFGKPPVVSETVYVEIEIDRAISWQHASSKRPAIFTSNQGQGNLIGQINRTDLPVVYLMVGDSLIMLNIGDCNLKVGDWIDVQVEGISLFDMNL